MSIFIKSIPLPRTTNAVLIMPEMSPKQNGFYSEVG